MSVAEKVDELADKHDLEDLVAMAACNNNHARVGKIKICCIHADSRIKVTHKRWGSSQWGLPCIHPLADKNIIFTEGLWYLVLTSGQEIELGQAIDQGLCLEQTEDSKLGLFLVVMFLGAVFVVFVLLSGLFVFLLRRSKSPPSEQLRAINIRLLRVADIVFILVFSPLLIFLSLLTALIIYYYTKTNGSNIPVMYRRSRIGYKGKRFMIYKFRSLF